MMASRAPVPHHLHVAPDPIRLLTDMIVPRAVDSLDLNEVVGEIDLDRTLERVDLNALLARLDLDALIARIDLNGVLSRVDIEAIIDRVDLDQVLGRVDIDQLMDRININDIVKRVQVDAIVTATASQTGYRVLTHFRRQLLGLDVLVTRLVNRVRSRTVDEPVVRQGSYSGQLAGAASRLLAFLVDAILVFLLFAGAVAVVSFLASLFVGHKIAATSGGGLWHIIALIGFALVYQWVGLVIAGRSVGKLLSGLRVTAPDGTAVGPIAALRRVVVYPFSFILGLGLIGIVIGRQHRALHDVAAPSRVRYDWGDHQADIGASLARLIERRGLSAKDRAGDGVTQPTEEAAEGAAEAATPPADAPQPAAKGPAPPASPAPADEVVTGGVPITDRPTVDNGMDPNPAPAGPPGRQPGEDS
jgi:uncharacterized RDD family membrane protein YckC